MRARRAACPFCKKAHDTVEALVGERAVQADEAQVERSKIGGTPSCFINGRKLVGAQPIAVFRAQIDAALAAK